MDAIEAAETILRCIDFIQTSRQECCEMQGELDKQLCDLAHQLEFTNVDIQRGYKIAKQMQDAYRERRRVKDELEVLRIIYDHAIDVPACKKFTADLTSHLGGAKKRSKQMEDRIYTPRSKKFQPKEDLL